MLHKKLLHRAIVLMLLSGLGGGGGSFASTGYSTATVAPPPIAQNAPTASPPAAVLAPTPSPSSVHAGPLRMVVPMPSDLGQVTALRAVDGGSLWAVATGGYLVLSEGAWHTQTLNPTEILVGVDDTGRVWLLQENGGRIAFRDGDREATPADAGWLPVSDATGLQGRGIVSDAAGQVWLATDQDVRVYDGVRWTVFAPRVLGMDPAADPDLSMWFTLKSARDTGQVWVGRCDWSGPGPLGGGGMRWLDGRAWRGAGSPMDEGCVTAIEEDVQGRIWVGLDADLWRTHPTSDEWERFAPPQAPEGYRFGYVADLTLDPAGEPWPLFALCGGASCDVAQARYRLRGGEWLPIGETSDEPQSLVFDGAGSAWMFLGGQVYRVEGDRLVQTAELTAEAVTVDAAGRVWVVGAPPGEKVALWVLEGSPNATDLPTPHPAPGSGLPLAPAVEEDPGIDGARATRLAFQALAELDSHDDEGVIRGALLAAESLLLAPTTEAAEALQSGLMRLPRRIHQWDGGLRFELISSDDRWLVLRKDASRELWELPATGNTLMQPRQVGRLPLDDGTEGMIFGPGDKWLISWTADRLQIWRVDDGESVGTWTPSSGPIYSVEPSVDKRRLFLVSKDEIQVVDASSLPRLRELASIPREGVGAGYTLSPDGQWVALVSGDGMQVNLWRAETRILAQQVSVSQAPMHLLFHPNGTHLVGSDETAVHIWDVESGAEVATVKTGRAWPGTAFSATGKWLITPGASGYWDVDVFPFPPVSTQLTAAESVLHTWNGDSADLAFVFSPDDRWLLRYEGCTQKRCALTRDVTVWNMERSNVDDQELNLTLTGRIDHASFSPDGSSLLTVHTSATHVSHVWRLPDGEEVARLPGYQGQLSHGGRWLFGHSGDDGPLQLWAAGPGQHWRAMRHSSTYFAGYRAGALAFSPDGRWLATGGVDNLVRVWDSASGAQQAALEHDEIYYLDLRVGIGDLAFSPDGQMLASLNDQGDLRLWQMSAVASPAITDTQPVAQFRTPPWSTVTFSPDSQWLLADYGVWNTVSGEQKYGTELYGGYALSPDGRSMASRKDDGISLRDFASGEIIHEFEHQDGLGNLAFGPNGRWLVSVGGQTVRMWDTTSGQLAHQVNLDGRLQGYAVSPDSHQIAVGSSGSPPVVWDIQSGETVSHLAPTAVAAHPLAFSPDGQSLVVSDLTGSIRVFYVATGTEASSLPRTIQFSQVAFTPDGRQLVTTDTDGNVRFWFWQPEELIAEACQHLPRNLTAQEWQLFFGDEPYRATCDDLPAPADGEE